MPSASLVTVRSCVAMESAKPIALTVTKSAASKNVRLTNIKILQKLKIRLPHRNLLKSRLNESLHASVKEVSVYGIISGKLLTPAFHTDSLGQLLLDLFRSESARVEFFFDFPVDRL